MSESPWAEVLSEDPLLAAVERMAAVVARYYRSLVAQQLPEELVGELVIQLGDALVPVGAEPESDEPGT